MNEVGVNGLNELLTSRETFNVDEWVATNCDMDHKETLMSFQITKI